MRVRVNTVWLTPMASQTYLAPISMHAAGAGSRSNTTIIRTRRLKPEKPQRKATRREATTSSASSGHGSVLGGDCASR
ncbi:hypothetical protein KCU81_g865, partial [Aureobasidium melanogenum]